MGFGGIGGIDKEQCLNIAKEITITTIQSGQLSINANDVADFFSTIYSRVITIGMKAIDDLNTD